MKQALLLGALALGLSACRVTVQPSTVQPGVVQPGAGVSVAARPNLITTLRPERGAGSVYYVGERVRFDVRTRTAGYLTLVALDPDGYGNVLLRDTYVAAGRTLVGANYALQITPPRGLERVRAIFTTSRPRGNIVFSGRYDQRGFNSYTDSYLNGYGPGARDVAETYLYIR